MSWIAGIDYSTHAIDVVLIDENDERPPQWHRHALEGQDAFDRARRLGSWGQSHYIGQGWYAVWGGVHWDDIRAVGIEDPRGQNAGALYRIQGAILQRVPGMLLVQPWIPSQWRKAVGLPGNCSKDTVFEHVVETIALATGESTPFSVADWPQDACDAYCIALATRQALIREEAA